MKYLLLILLILANTSFGMTQEQQKLFDEGSKYFLHGDFIKAKDYWQPIADDGDAQAEFNIGTLYLRGKGVPKNSIAALSWFRKAAEHGNANAQFNLAEAFRTGEGVEINPVQAFTFYKKSAEQDLSVAQLSLAIGYETGYGTEVDYEKAVFLYEKLVLKNDSEAETNLGNLYMKGLGVKRDIQKADQLFLQSAKNGYPRAQCIVGNNLLKGFNRDKDEALGKYWISLAAKNGFPIAFFILGDIYYNQQPDADFILAYVFYSLANRMSDADGIPPVATKNANIAATKLNQEQLQKANNFVKLWIKHLPLPETDDQVIKGIQNIKPEYISLTSEIKKNP